MGVIEVTYPFDPLIVKSDKNISLSVDYLN